jgi:uncharacterized protein
MTPDVNVLVAALRPDHPHHTVAHSWLESAFFAATSDATSGVSFTLMPMVIASYLRLVTSAKIFAKPTAMKDAVAAVDTLLSAPGVVLATLGPEWAGLQKLCLQKNLSGNDVPDAWLAAATSQIGEHLVTFDRDFKKLLPRNQVTFLTSTG